MRLSREELGALFEHIVKRQRPGIQPDPRSRSHHRRLPRGGGACLGRPEDEPAALFLALARRSRALGPIAKAAVPAAAHAAAFSIGLDLVRDDAELALDCLRVLRQAIARKNFGACYGGRGAGAKTGPLPLFTAELGCSPVKASI